MVFIIYWMVRKMLRLSQEIETVAKKGNSRAKAKKKDDTKARSNIDGKEVGKTEDDDEKNAKECIAEDCIDDAEVGKEDEAVIIEESAGKSKSRRNINKNAGKGNDLGGREENHNILEKKRLRKQRNLKSCK